MHMTSKRDLGSAELETMRTSRSPTTVMTANGEVQTREEATVYVKQLDLFVNVVLLEETPTVLSLEKLCEDHGYIYHWISGQEPHLIRNGIGLSASSSSTTHSPVFLHHLHHRISVFDVNRYTEKSSTRKKWK